jgi:hypothetical protein
LPLLLCLIEEINDPELPKLRKPIRSHLDDILSPVEQADSLHAELLDLMPQPIVDALGLAWHHDHLSYQSSGKHKSYHQRERQPWLDFSEGLREHQFEPLKALVFEQLDAIIQASSLVEMVNAFIRPYLNSCKGHITQETLNLIMFYHNHRRYKGGKRQGKAPFALLTGEALEANWVDLFIRHTQEVAPGTSVVSNPALAWGSPRPESPTPSEPPASQVTVDLGMASDIPWLVMDAEAA